MTSAHPHFAGRETPVIVVVAAAVGVLVGAVVLALEHAVDDVVHHLYEVDAWIPALVVASGIVMTAVVTRWLSGGGTATTEVYVGEFHRTEPSLHVRRSPGRLLAAFTTLAAGAPLGMEGPAVYTGAVAATVAHRRLRWLGAIRHHPILVAGAAAGIAAVFKAPVAGAIFALEAPYRGRVAGERVLPAIFGSSAGYLTMASIDGFEPEAALPAVDLSYGRVVASVVLGLVIGMSALGVIALVRAAEGSHERWPVWVRVASASLGLALIGLVGHAATDEPIGLTSGNQIFDWVLDPSHSVLVLILVVALRALGPAVTIFGGGVGGLFIPLMAIGAVIGRLFADAASVEELTLFVLVGAACMLGAGYATPLTGVVFVAEYTGQVAIIVPALAAMAATQLIAGGHSVSPHQLE